MSDRTVKIIVRGSEFEVREDYLVVVLDLAVDYMSNNDEDIEGINSAIPSLAEDIEAIITDDESGDG